MSGGRKNTPLTKISLIFVFAMKFLKSSVTALLLGAVSAAMLTACNPSGKAKELLDDTITAIRDKVGSDTPDDDNTGSDDYDADDTASGSFKSNMTAPSQAPERAERAERASAASYDRSMFLTGKVKDKYDICMYLDTDDEGRVTGRYAYASTLRKYGDKPANYFPFDGHIDGDRVHLQVYHNQTHQPFESWTLWVDRSGQRLTMNGNLSNENTGEVMAVSLARS